MTRRTLIVIVATLALVAAGLVALFVVRGGDDGPVARAAHLVPAETKRMWFTDWSGVRADLAPGLGADSSGDDIRGFVSDAFDADLVAASALEESAVPLQLKYGFSPATVEWEAFAQSEEGAVSVLQLADDADPDEIADNLDHLGYQRPSEDDGVWVGGVDLMPRIDPTISPQMQFVAVLADESLVLTSDHEEYLESALDVARGDADALAEDPAVDDVVSAAPTPLTGVLYAGEFACGALAMSQAAPGDQAAAERAATRAGEVHPFEGLYVALGTDERLTVSMAFADEDQAAADAESRARLAAGDAPGKGGSWAERFSVKGARSTGSLATLDLSATPGAFAFSEITAGPVSFLTC